MEGFPCIRLAFWRGRGQAGESEPVGTCEKQMQCRFSLSARYRASLAGACPACPLHLLKSKSYIPLFSFAFTFGKFVKMPIEYPLPLSYDREAFTRYCVFVIRVFYIVLIFGAG